MPLPLVAVAGVAARAVLPAISRAVATRGAASAAAGNLTGGAATRTALAEGLETAGQGTLKNFASRQLQNTIKYKTASAIMRVPQQSSFTMDQQNNLQSRASQFQTGLYNSPDA